MSITYTGILLNQVPTGFGTYTGITLINQDAYPLEYTISVSDTNLVGLSTADSKDGFLSNTIYISDTLQNSYSQQQSIITNLNPTESGVLYVLHKPFNNFKVGNQVSGYETATITINTKRSNGYDGDSIVAQITGQRTLTGQISSRVGSFYATKDYSSKNGTFLNFNWSVLNQDYITGFNLDISSVSNFSSLVTGIKYNLSQNTNSNDPQYGTFESFKDSSYSLLVANLNLSTDYYSRIQAVNLTGGTGVYTYCTGYTEYYPILDATGYSGLLSSPGSNLKLDPTGLYLTKQSDYESNFDLYSYILNANGGSVDFTKYTGINIKFSPATSTFASYISTDINNGAINFVPPSDQQLIFNTGINGIFRIELEFENIGVYGCGGDGLYWNADGSYTNPLNGGPIFNLSYVSTTDASDKEKRIDYYIYKDINSIFYAGPAGGKGWLIKNNTFNNDNAIRFDGLKINNLQDYNLQTISIT